MKRAIRLTESDLHRIIKESVNRILREEWESPLEKAKKNKNNFDNVKKIDVSKFQKKTKKPKAGTFEDLPSFSKLKNLKNESRNSRIVNEEFNHDQYVQLVQDAYDKVAEASDLIVEASSIVQSEGTYHIGYLNEAYKALGTASEALKAADASMPKSGRPGYLDMWQSYD